MQSGVLAVKKKFYAYTRVTVESTENGFGVPQKHWSNWNVHDYLALILEREIGGFSYILLEPMESKKLLEMCGTDKNNNNDKKINMRIYKDEIIRFEKDKRFNVENRIKNLPCSKTGTKIFR
ncbi:MAG: hypothetical protein GY749_42670 [Desulfobacteraceae bacterium]|nr:hypothetical protein [Desulfobacteraceae bacterium]